MTFQNYKMLIEPQNLQFYSKYYHHTVLCHPFNYQLDGIELLKLLSLIVVDSAGAEKSGLEFRD